MKGTLKGCEMVDLFERVLHHIEGGATETQNWQTLDGIKTVEFQSFGPDRWIENVHERGRMTGIDCLAMILFAVDKSFDKEQEHRIVEGWAAELRKAVSAGEIQARDPVTLLALETLPEGFEWLLSMADADRFIAARGIEWRFGEVVLHLFNEFEQAIQNRRFPPWTRATKQQTPATDTAARAPAARESVEQRRARYLDLFETEERRDKRGALQRVADSEGIDRSNLKKDIDKARAARDTEKPANAWTSQLGKRKG